MNALSFFRWVGRVEGLSFVLLMFVGVPLKYASGIPEGVRHLGRIHGLLVVVFLVALGLAKKAERWNGRRAAWAVFSSMIPLGFVFFEASLRPDSERAL
jgi:integral membrane protein